MAEESPAAVVEGAKDKVADTAEVVADVTPDPVEEVAENPQNEIPPWGKELTEKVDKIMESLTVPTAAVAEGVEDTPLEMPKDGGVVEDENPLGVPWTHRGLFR